MYLDDRSIETRLCLRGHRKRPGSPWCHTCRAEQARYRYEQNAEVERDRKHKFYKKMHPKAKREAYSKGPRGNTHSRKEKKMEAACTHASALLGEHGHYHCLDCNSYINPYTMEVTSLAQETVPAEVTPSIEESKKGRSGRRTKKDAAPTEATIPAAPPHPGTAPITTVFGTGLSESVVATPPPPGFVPPAPPAAAGSSAEPPKAASVRKGRKAPGTPGDAPTITGNPETDALHRDPGPWHDQLKCPIPTCFQKLQWAPHNIVVNGDVTYHYKCSADEGVAVQLFIDHSVIVA